MSVLVHWIPTFAGAFVLLIAALVLDWRIRVEDRARGARGDPPQHGSINGVRFFFNERGERTAVLIDLRKNRRLWQELIDAALARQRPAD